MTTPTYTYNKFLSTNIYGDFSVKDATDFFGNPTSDCTATFQRQLTAGSISSNTTIVATSGLGTNGTGTNKTDVFPTEGSYYLYNRGGTDGMTYFLNNSGTNIGGGGFQFQMYSSNGYLVTPLQILPDQHIIANANIHMNWTRLYWGELEDENHFLCYLDYNVYNEYIDGFNLTGYQGGQLSYRGLDSNSNPIDKPVLRWSAAGIKIYNTTNASSSTAGSLVVAGGIGVGGDINTAGSIFMNGNKIQLLNAGDGNHFLCYLGYNIYIMNI